MNGKVFGYMPDGRPVHQYEIRNERMVVRVAELGATLVSCAIDGRDVALGYDTAEEYLNNVGNMGATVGRYANRIRNGRFTLNGRAYQPSCNRPPHCLHGGKIGFHQKLWRVVQYTPQLIILKLHSPDGDQGFPGNLTVTATYSLHGTALFLTYTAISDADTICSLANHSYWNLAGHNAGHAALCEHVFTLRSIARCELDGDTVPTGRLCPVAGTVFDLRSGVRLGDMLDNPALKPTRGFDHPYALSGKWGCAAAVHYWDTAMEIWTDAPCMQVYSGNGLPNISGKCGAQYGPQVGFCLETQQFPDAPNCAAFPSAVLHTGETKAYRTEYRFIKER